MYYIGLDIHKKDTRFCVLDANGKVVCGKRIPTIVADIVRLFERIEAKDDEFKIVMEATGFYF